MNDNETRIKTFLSRFFRQHDLQPDEDIFALGFVNSLLAMQLVNFVEKEFAVTIDDEDLDLANFRSLRSMDALVERKRAAASAAAVPTPPTPSTPPTTAR
jgi:methoxymalonate biosynthesis acyl carrier protein